MKRQSPIGTTTKVYALYLYVSAAIQEEQLGAGRLAWALATLIIVRINALARMVQTIDAQSQLLSLSVNGSVTCYADILGPICHQ